MLNCAFLYNGCLSQLLLMEPTRSTSFYKINFQSNLATFSKKEANISLNNPFSKPLTALTQTGNFTQC